MSETNLEAYAIQLARPSFCEIQLSKFLAQIKISCTTQQDVERLFKEIKQGKKHAKTLKVVQEILK